MQPFDLDKYRSIGVVSRRSGPMVREMRTDAGRVKATLDEAGNVVTEHAKNDRVDVQINAQPVRSGASTHH